MATKHGFLTRHIPGFPIATLSKGGGVPDAPPEGFEWLTTDDGAQLTTDAGDKLYVTESEDY